MKKLESVLFSVCFSVCVAALMGCSVHAGTSSTADNEAPIEQKDAPKSPPKSATPPRAESASDGGAPAADAGPPAQTVKTSGFDRLYGPTADAPDAATLEGIWATSGDGGGVATVDIRLELRAQTLVFASRCSSDHAVVTVGVSVNAAHDAASIEVTDSADTSEPFDIADGKSGRCRASVGAGHADFTLADGKLETLGLTFTKVGN